MTIAAGLCSITFRALGAEAVIALAVRAGVSGIEWGSDVHVPPDDLAAATAVRERCADAGLAVASYGTYLGAGGAHAGTDGEIERTLDAAQALGAPMVRAWTELGITPDAPANARDRVAEHTERITDAAAERGLVVALEFHPGTLTHTATSANRLLDALDRPNLRTHWQPDPSLAPAEALAELRAVLPRLAHLHVFAWGPTGIGDRRPLAEGGDLWPAAVALADDAPPVPGGRYALCEYVADDDPGQFVADASTLRRWTAP